MKRNESWFITLKRSFLVTCVCGADDNDDDDDDTADDGGDKNDTSGDISLVISTQISSTDQYQNNFCKKSNKYFSLLGR